MADDRNDRDQDDDQAPRETERDFEREYNDGPVEYPKPVSVAGVLWIVFGAITLLNVAVGLLLVAAVAGGFGELGARGTGMVCGAVLSALFGAVFIHVGVQSVRGTARDTLGNGIGSIIFGLLQLAVGVLKMIQADAIVGSIGLLSGVGLLVAGVLALVGRDKYKAWRRSQRVERDRRRDDSDDRPRRARRRGTDD